MPPPTAQPAVIVVAVRLFGCPYCAAPITPSMRLSYPASVLGCYAPVYRCRSCGRHIGAPVAGKAE